MKNSKAHPNRQRNVALQVLTCSLILFVADSGYGKDWLQWRGPNGNGIAIHALSADGKSPPVEFNDAKNVIWKTKLPGRGHGSPTILGNRIFLASADEKQNTQFLMAVDRSSGEIVWKETLHVNRSLPEIHDKNTHASSTVACDGERLFVTLYSDSEVWLHCHGLNGDALWKKELAKFRPKYPFGYAASPLVYRNLVIATSESEAETAIIGLDRATGNEVWRTRRPQNSSYSSPALLNVGGRIQLVMCGGREIRSYDPSTGKDLWKAVGAAKHTAGTVVGEGNYVLASGGYPQSETTCVLADGSARVVWKNNQKSYEQSMLVHDGYVYTLTDKGVAYCWNLESGKEMWKKRLEGPVSSSPVLVDDKIYTANEKGKLFVFLATPDRYVELGRNTIGDDIFPTPTFLDGQIFMRVGVRDGQSRSEMLYCFGSQ